MFDAPQYSTGLRTSCNYCCLVSAQVALYSMYVACMAFHAKVSDPVIGGTYMTLLNTVTNLGGNWPSTLALWMVDPLTWKECQGAVGQSCGSPEAAGVSAGESEGTRLR